MENTYTYIARNIENPEQVITFTLQDHHVSVDLGTPLEQVETALQRIDVEEYAANDEESTQGKIWLRPLAVSLLERGLGPFQVADVNASVEDDWLRISAWYRAGGLALAPIALMNGRVDNPQAAQAFVEELGKRKSEVSAFGFYKVLDYWLTWILACTLLFGLFQFWRRKNND